MGDLSANATSPIASTAAVSIHVGCAVLLATSITTAAATAATAAALRGHHRRWRSRMWCFLCARELE
eukprot:2578296-Pleurochrysis_carterae.AAC.1